MTIPNAKAAANGFALAQLVMAALQDDIVSYAEFLQLAEDAFGDVVPMCLESALKSLFDSGVQIGEAHNEDGDHVKFVAWRGNANDRISRVKRILRDIPEAEREFAIWLCLEPNVDSYE